MSSSIDFLAMQCKPSTSYAEQTRELPLEVVVISPELHRLDLGDVSRTPRELVLIIELLLTNVTEATRKIDELQEAMVNIPIGFSRETLLSIAVNGNHLQVVELLVNKGACLTCTNLKHQTALHHAADQGNRDMIAFLLSKGAPIDCIDTGYITPLYFAVKQGHVEAVKLFIEKGATIHCVNYHGETPLHWAAFLGNIEIASLLIEALKERSLLEVNSKNSAGQTPLHLTAYCQDIRQSIAIATLLLKEGADPNMGNNSGFTPFHWALRCCDGYMNLSKPFCFYDFPKPKACDWKSLEEFLDLFLHYGADINRANAWGWTPLHYAIKERAHPRLFHLLIQKGASLHSKNDHEETPFEFASIWYPEIASLLRTKEKKKCVIL